MSSAFAVTVIRTITSNFCKVIIVNHANCSPCGFDGGEELLLFCAEQGLPLDVQHDFRMQVLDGLHGQLGQDGLVHQRLPSRLDLAVGEVTTELDAPVNRVKIVRLFLIDRTKKLVVHKRLHHCLRGRSKMTSALAY